jgi:hypothetical protein
MPLCILDVQSFSKQALEPVGGGVEQFDRVFREDYAKYARLVKENHREFVLRQLKCRFL